MSLSSGWSQNGSIYDPNKDKLKQAIGGLSNPLKIKSSSPIYGPVYNGPVSTPKATTNKNTSSSGGSSGGSGSSKSSGKSEAEKAEDSRKKEERKALKEQEQLTNQRKTNFEKMLAELLGQTETEYAGYETKGKEDLASKEQTDFQKLSGLFGAYGTSDSEQRMQTEERMRSDYGKKLTDFMGTLAGDKSKVISGYKAKNYEQQDELLSESAANRLALKKYYDSLEQQDFNNNIALQELGIKSAGGSGGGMTPSQSASLQEDYFNTMKSLLVGEAYGGQPYGRERVLNEMIARYGDIFDEESIKSDVAKLTPDFWEDSVKNANKNPNSTSYF